MKLDDKQKNQIINWVTEGSTLSDIQKKIKAEWGTSITYMEVRFLIDDLGIELGQSEKESTSSTQRLKDKEDIDPAGVEELPHYNGGVSVTVDRVMRPGALVSGSVTFNDGVAAKWQMDQMGRLGIIPSKEGYKPSQEDLMQFQKTLQNELQKAGF